MPPPAVADRTTRHATAYEVHRGYVMAVLARRCGWLEPDEREAALHDAWAILLEKEASGALDVAAMRGPQVRAYLVQTAINRALDEGRRVGRSRNEPLADRDDFVDAAAPPEDVVDAGLDGARVREIVGELTARQQTIVKLRFFFDRTPGEIQRLLRITERAYRRDLERAMRVVSERYELVLEGRFCESRASLIRAYVAGIAGPNRAREARDHLATCPACRRFAIELRDATGRFAALLPLPAVAAAGGGHGVLGQLAEALGGGRESASQATAQAKQQLALLTTRVDPTAATVVGSARPGAVAAAVAGCLALSGSAATYCAVVGVPAPLRGAVGAQARAPHEHPKKAAPKARPRKAQTATVAAPAPTPTLTTAARTAPATTTRATTTTPAQAARAARAAKAARKAAAKRRHDVTTAQEFGAEGGGEPVGGSTARTASTGSSSGSTATQAPGTSATSSAAPARDAPTEFDP